MLVGTALITIVFVAAVVVWRFVRDDSTSGPSRVSQDWSEIAFVDRISGDVTMVDPDGEVVGNSSGNGRVGSVFANDGVVSVANSRSLVVLAEPDDDDMENLEVAIPSRGQVTTLTTESRTLLVIGSPNGGNVMIVDPVERTVVDIGQAVSETLPTTPLMFVDTLQTDDDGSIFAIADATNFQTIAITTDDGSPVFLADQPVAVSDDLVATSQTIGLQADISLMTLERSTEAMVSAEIPAGGALVDDRLTMVSIGGGVFRVETGADEVERVGSLATPAGETVRGAVVAAGGDRLVVNGVTFAAVIDLDGNTVYSTVLPESVEFVRPHATWACLPVGGPGHWASIVDLTSGEHLADLTDVEVVEIVDDGCSVLVERSGSYEVISPDGLVVIGRHDEVVLAPDGRAVITVDGDVAELVPIDELTLGDPVDLSNVADDNTMIAFVPE